jgi:hypothetical protein
MLKKQRFLAISAITLIFLAMFTAISSNLPAMAQSASLTGRIFDYGKDTDGDSLYNFLVIYVEVNASESATYRVSVNALRDVYYNYFYDYTTNETYLTPGLHNVSLSFNGIAIYGRKLNATHVDQVSLSYTKGMTQYSQWWYGIPLSKTYNYALFDTGATIIGIVHDEGVDTDSDGLYNSMQISVEINVSDAGSYRIHLSELFNASGYYVSVYSDASASLSPGAQIMNFSLPGAAIYASHITSISTVYQVELYFDDNYMFFQLDVQYYLPLTKTYSYSEFETPAYFTGKVTDMGVDNDGNLKFDYLQISAEINVTEAGNYYMDILHLVDDASNYIPVWETSLTTYFDVGLHLVNLTVYGPTIYTSHLNPKYIEVMRLYRSGLGFAVDNILMIPLSKTYNYTDFESHVLLTGHISDLGIDSDGDGLFDYLAVGVEINVTEAGTYRIEVGYLMEKANGTYRYFYDFRWVENHFDAGVQTVYFNYSGARIAYEHFSPTNVSGIHLMESTHPDLEFGYIPSAPLSQKYDYTLFNGPLKDMQVNFVVYPNATVGVSGATNFTRMYPENTGPQINGTLHISTAGSLTTGSANGTFVLPIDEVLGLGFGSPSANFTATYNGGVLNAALDASMILPSSIGDQYPANASDFSFTSAYSNGILDINLLSNTQPPPLPFNLADSIVKANFDGNEVTGNITFRALSGFPFSDIVVYFDGNRTDLHLTGNLTVIYGNYFGMEVNATIVDHIINEIPGPTGLISNMTMGFLQCTQLNTIKTPLINVTEYGAQVGYDATVKGNLTGFLANLTSEMLFGGHSESFPAVYAAWDSALSSIQGGSLQLIYWSASGTASVDMRLESDVKALWSNALLLVPPTAPPEAQTQVEAFLKVANATAYALNDFNLNASYSSAQHRLDLSAQLSANVTQMKSDIIPILPDTMPPQLHGIVESFLNTTYCTLNSLNATVNLVSGTGSFNVDWLMQGDFKAQTNHVKRFYIDYLNATSPWMLNWETRLLNMTEININNFNLEYKTGGDWMYTAFDGLVIEPPKDQIDPIRFQLYKLFNATSYDPYEPPREFERLRILVTGGSNGTHTVLLYTPGTMSSADEFSLDYKSMTWHNTTISGLRDLRFHVAYQGIVDYLAKTYYVPVFTNSTVSSFGFSPTLKSISFNVTGTAGTGFCNVTIPKALLNAAIGDWVVKVDGATLPLGNYTVVENAEYVFIFLAYPHSSHTVEVAGTWIVTEFQPDLLLIGFIILSIVAAMVAVKQRKRLITLKAKYQNTIRTFIARLYKPET